MRTRLVPYAMFAACSAIVAWGTPAWAEDGDIRSIVQEEVESYMAAQGERKSDEKKTFRAFWKDGLRFETDDKKVKLKLGGRILFDAVFFGDDDYVKAGGRKGDQHDGVEFRRVRLGMSGDVGKYTQFKVEFDIAGGDVSFKSVYVGFHNLRDCLGCGFPNVRVGHFFEPFSLEQLSSSNYMPLMNRSIATLTFAPERSTGIMLYDRFRGGTIGYDAGVFLNSNARFNEPHDGFGDADLEEDGYGYTGRLWWVPWFDCDCTCKKLHLGVAYSRREETDLLRFRARPDAHLRDALIDTNSSEDAAEVPFLADSEAADLFNAEAALVYGPLSLQGEYFMASVDSAAGDDPTFTGWYAQASYWLTGECRNYKEGKFGMVKPCCDFLAKDCSCKGGLELAARYAEVDLNDGNIAGGELSAFTFGLNWVLNPNVRVMANFSVVGVDDGIADETLNIFQTRIQMNF